jgi:choline kinase
LNAGEGKRLRPLTLETPKCLLAVGNNTILENQLSNLIDCGITDIIMVLGYLSEKIMEFAKRKFPNLNFKFIFNEEYAKTNTVYSLRLALKEVKDDFILLNGDVFFHSEILRRLIDCKYKTCLAVCKHKLGEEEVKVLLKDDLVISIGKHLEPSKADGEFIGVAKFSKNENNLLAAKIDEILKNSDGVTCYFEAAVNLMLNDLGVFAVDISKFPSVEIDTHEDLMRARKLASKFSISLKMDYL